MLEMAGAASLNDRRIRDVMAQMIRVGFVTARKPEKHRVQVRIMDTTTNELVTDWLPVLVPRASADLCYDLPDVGDQVLVLFMPIGLEQGFVIGSMYGKEKPPVKNPEKFHRTFKDGTVLEYDRAAHELTVSVKGRGHIMSDGPLRVESKSVLTLAGPRVIVQENAHPHMPYSGSAAGLIASGLQTAGGVAAGAVSGAVQSAGGMAAGTLSNAVQSAGSMAQDALSGAMQYAGAMTDPVQAAGAIAEGLQGAADSITNAFTEALQGAAGSVTGAITDAVQSAAGNLTGVLSQAAQSAADIASGSVGDAVQAASAITDAIADTFPLTEALEAAGGMAAGALSGAVQAAAGRANGMINVALETAGGSAASALAGALETAGGIAMSGIPNALEAAGSVAASAIADAVAAGSTVADALQIAAPLARSALVEKLASASATASGVIADTAQSEAVTVLESITATAQDAAVTAQDSITEAAQAAAAPVREADSASGSDSANTIAENLAALAGRVEATGTDKDRLLFCLPDIAAAEAERQKEEKDKRGWLYLHDMFEKWFGGSANADALSNPDVFWVDMDWILSHERASDAFNELSEERYLFSPNARRQLAEILKRDGKLLQEGRAYFDYTNLDWTYWQPNYFQQITALGMEAESVDGLMAAMGNFQLRALARGYTEPTENGHRIVIQGVSIVVWDSFNFEGQATLGFWQCSPPRFSSFWLSNGSALENDDFKIFRMKYGAGNDFMVLSQPEHIDQTVEFSYETEL